MTRKIDQLNAFVRDAKKESGRAAGLNLARSIAAREALNPLDDSLRASHGALLIMAEKEPRGEEYLLVCAAQSALPNWLPRLNGAAAETADLRILRAPCTLENLPALQAALPNLAPAPLGLTPSFGFGDRLGLATPGHIAALQAYGQTLAPIFAQQSIREMTRTERTPHQVMADATWGALRAGWQNPVGADADHLKTRGDVDEMVRAGFTFFTIDPSDHVDQQADDYSEAQVDQKYQALLTEKVSGAGDVLGLYAGRPFDLGAEAIVLNTSALKRAVVKYGRALAFIYGLAEHTARAMAGRRFELEISVDETDQPTTVLEHLFLGLELKRHSVPVVSLAPRFGGDFEKGVDYRGDLARFEADLVQHAAIAQQYGPYKISLHSGSDKFGVYPQIGRITNQVFHVKTAGTSYLEALRVACRTDPDFFREMADFARQCFETDRATYHISATLEGTPGSGALDPQDLEGLYLDEDNGRQIMHVTYGSVLTAREGGAQGAYRFRDRLLALLREHRGLHDQLLCDHLGRHLRLLCRGEG
ncbi:MAG: tagaturonate epimerase family protein [Desulfobacterales bacterium]|jgi:hypothetical protein